MTSWELQHLTSTQHPFWNEAKRRFLHHKSLDRAKISYGHVFTMWHLWSVLLAKT